MSAKRSLYIVDVNECIIDNGGCAEICTNILGSFRCSCRTGYRLNVDGKSCDGKLTFYSFISSFKMAQITLRNWARGLKFLPDQKDGNVPF